MKQQGFSLIELLVGLVIGLVTTLIIGQTMAVFEGEKRTTSGGADAQTNGYAALLVMERDLRAAGAGMVGPDYRLACEGATYRQYIGAQEPLATSPPNGFLPPVRIVHNGSNEGGGADGGDAIVLVRSDITYSAPLPSELASNWSASNCASQAAVQPALGTGDLFLVAPADHRGRIDDLAVPPHAELQCYLVQLSASPTTGSCPVDYLSFDTAGAQPYNSGATLPGTPMGGDLIIAMGSRPYLRYAVHEGRLMQAEQMAYVQRGESFVDDERFVDDVVYIAAQYGIDTDCGSTMAKGCFTTAPASVSVDRFVEPTGNWAVTSLTPARFARIKAIRLAVVVRAPQYNKDEVSPATITLWQTLNGTDDAAPVFDVPDRHFRYRVFETVIPLKNMIWGLL